MLSKLKDVKDAIDNVAVTVGVTSKDNVDNADLTDPMVNHPLVGPEWLDICGDTGRGGSLDAPLVDGVLAYWGHYKSATNLMNK